MSTEGHLSIEFERPLVQPVADHIVTLIGEALEPFGASVSATDLPIEGVREASLFPMPALDPDLSEGASASGG